MQSESTQWNVQCMVHENNMKIKVSVCWCPNKLTYGIAQLICIYTLLHFWYFISSKNSKYFLPYPLHKKWSFPLSISSANVTKSAVNCRFGHILLKKSLMENFGFFSSDRSINTIICCDLSTWLVSKICWRRVILFWIILFCPEVFC